MKRIVILFLISICLFDFLFGGDDCVVGLDDIMSIEIEAVVDSSNSPNGFMDQNWKKLYDSIIVNENEKSKIVWRILSKNNVVDDCEEVGLILVYNDFNEAKNNRYCYLWSSELNRLNDYIDHSEVFNLSPYQKGKYTSKGNTTVMVRCLNSGSRKAIIRVLEDSLPIQNLVEYINELLASRKVNGQGQSTDK